MGAKSARNGPEIMPASRICTLKDARRDGGDPVARRGEPPELGKRCTEFGVGQVLTVKKKERKKERKDVLLAIPLEVQAKLVRLRCAEHATRYGSGIASAEKQ